ncbi:hypothetical protein RJD44_00450 [Buchnera aphidicola (Astegopteryx bambusae)]|uniref:primosomal protein N' family DNA-binding protein n=1 Tax=Buchnera aphidicola TaxID=9 RepID=UPI0031B83836
MTFIVEISLPIPIRKTFFYFYNFYKTPIIGGRVLVNFNNKKTLGVILSYKLYKNKDINIKLKQISFLVDKVSIFNKSVWKTMLLCSKYYKCSMNFIVFFSIPNFFKTKKIIKKNLTYTWSITDYGKFLKENFLKRCKKQIFALKLLRKNDLSLKKCKEYKLSNYVLNELKKKNICVKKYVFCKKVFYKKFKLQNNIFFKKNIFSKNKLLKIINNLNVFKVWLITNMLFFEKLKFYATLFSEILKKKLKILFIVPNIILLNKFNNEFRKNFFLPVLIYHSKLTENEKFFCWKIFNKQSPLIIISTKIGIFLPIINLGMIVIDEEHNCEYRIIDKWIFNVKNVLLLRAYYENVPVILESFTPELNTLYNVNNKKIEKIKIFNKTEKLYKKIEKIFVDISSQRFMGVFSIYLLNKMKKTLKKGKNICIIFDGIYNMFFFLSCSVCKCVLKCNFCNQICEFNTCENKIFCRFCFTEKKKIFFCEKCGNKKFNYKKCNIKFLIKNIKEIFYNISVVFLKNKIVNRNININSKCIFVVSNKDIYKYELKNVKLLVFPYIDVFFYFPNFRSIEKFSQAYFNIIKFFFDKLNFSFSVFVQTKLYKDNLFKKFFFSGYFNFSKYLLKNRKKCNLPPFSIHAILKLESKNKDKLFILLNKIIFFLKNSTFLNIKNFFFINTNYIYFNKYRKIFYYKILISYSSKNFLRKIFDKLINNFKLFLYVNNINLIFDIDNVESI